MDIQDIVSNETARQDVYKNLITCYQLPDEAVKTDLEALSKHLTALNSSALPYINSMREKINQNFELLNIEHARLFTGPFSMPAPPYGSVYIENERKVMGDSTMDAKKRYQDFGLDISRNFKEVPDHIVVELEFMSFLIFKEIESIEADLPEQTQEILLHQESFLTDHLNLWIPDFTKSVIEHAGVEYYSNLAKATRVFISEDHEYLKTISVPATQE